MVEVGRLRSEYAHSLNQIGSHLVTIAEAHGGDNYLKDEKFVQLLNDFFTLYESDVSSARALISNCSLFANQSVMLEFRRASAGGARSRGRRGRLPG